MDTVIIKIYGPDKFKFTTTTWFLPELIGRPYSDLSPSEKDSKRPYLRRFVFHPPPQPNYLPRIEVFETLAENRESIRYVLKLEFSVPKLLYGNSLQEVSENDMASVFETLKNTLSKVGVIVEKETIVNARVAAVHVCKNILLPESMGMEKILTELRRVDINKVVDVTEKEFKNGARVLHIYSGTIEHAFYDKVSDAMRPKGKRKDKGRIGPERAIIEQYHLQNREVFRYEYRVKKTQTVLREINRALGRKPKTFVAFKELFSLGLCKTMVLKSWRSITQRPENQLALLDSRNDLSLLVHIIAQSKNHGGEGHSMNRALISYGLTRAIHDHGVKELRRAILSTWNIDHPERLTQKIEMAAKLVDGLPFSDAISFVDTALERFELITPEILAKSTRQTTPKQEKLIGS